jgi:hypothetical protein
MYSYCVNQVRCGKYMLTSRQIESGSPAAAAARSVLETTRDDQTRAAQYLRTGHAIGSGCGMHSKLCVFNQYCTSCIENQSVFIQTGSVCLGWLWLAAAGCGAVQGKLLCTENCFFKYYSLAS